MLPLSDLQCAQTLEAATSKISSESNNEMGGGNVNNSTNANNTINSSGEAVEDNIEDALLIHHDQEEVPEIPKSMR